MATGRRVSGASVLRRFGVGSGARVPVPRPSGAVAKPSKATVQRGEEILARIEVLRGTIGESFYEMGELLGELAQESVYRGLGFGSFEELLVGRRVTSRMTALRLIEVARAFPRKLALELGVEKAYALVRYAAATPAADVARELAIADVTIAGKRVRSASVRDIVRATRVVRGKGEKAAEAAGPEAAGAARRLQAAFRRAGAKGAKARAERVDGVSWIVVRVPVEQAVNVTVSA